jgi:DNA-binding NtrC family response regulator
MEGVPSYALIQVDLEPWRWLMASKVVVIDNDSQVRGVVRAALKEDGFIAVGIGELSPSRAELSWSPADLAITDGFTTGSVTGASLLHRLFPSLRFLVLSGSVSRKLQIPFSSHCLSVLPKPCSLQTLRQAVRQTLTNEEDASIQEILDRGRLEFLMTAMRSHAIETH